MKAGLTVTALAFCLACAKADILVLDPTPRPSTVADSILVYLEEPTVSYETIALIEVSDQSWGMSLESLANRMRAEAAKLGGHAVIIGRETTESGAVIVPIGNMWYAGATKEKKLVGQVIVFTARTP